MPKNPSKNQKKASANNLKGKWGPKTSEGKKKSAQNGKKNQGPKSAKAKAIIVYARWKTLKGTLYDRSECLQCQQKCLGKTFSRSAPVKDYSFHCLVKVVQEYPSECFYYFRGLCGIRYSNNLLPKDYCLLDDPNLNQFSSTDGYEIRNTAELEQRKGFEKLKSIIEKYLAAIKDELEFNVEDFVFNGRSVRDVIKLFKICKTENREPGELEEEIKNTFLFC